MFQSLDPHGRRLFVNEVRVLTEPTIWPTKTRVSKARSLNLRTRIQMLPSGQSARARPSIERRFSGRRLLGCIYRINSGITGSPKDLIKTWISCRLCLCMGGHLATSGRENHVALLHHLKHVVHAGDLGHEGLGFRAWGQ